LKAVLSAVLLLLDNDDNGKAEAYLRYLDC
jgi:hypothetical protein